MMHTIVQSAQSTISLFWAIQITINGQKNQRLLALVILQLELCLLTSLAVSHQRTLKSKLSFNPPYLKMKRILSNHPMAVLVHHQVHTGSYFIVSMAFGVPQNFGLSGLAHI
jgi:hypothetical protein